MRTVAQAIAAAKYQVGHPNATVKRGGLCLAFVRQCWGFSPGGIPDAKTAWARASQKHTTGVPPKGAPVYWAGGRHGHIAISDGNWYCYSTDIRRWGRVDRVPMVQIPSSWGYRYLGWSGDYPGKGKLPLSGAATPTYAAFPGTAWFKRNPKSTLVTRMGKRLVALGCGLYKSGPGPQWTTTDRKSYAKWQRKLGYKGSAADGWPGASSWAKLKVPR